MNFRLLVFVFFFQICSFCIANVELTKIAKQVSKTQNDLIECKNNISKFLLKEATFVETIKKYTNVFCSNITAMHKLYNFSSKNLPMCVFSPNDLIKCLICVKEFVNYHSNIADEYKKTLTDLRVIRQNICEYQTQKTNLTNLLRDQTAQLEKLSDNVKKGQSKSNIDVLSNIALKAETIDELESEIEEECILGIWRDVKMEFGEFAIVKPFNVHNVKFFDVENFIEFRLDAGAMIFSPCTGFVTFAMPFKNFGTLIVISTTKCHVVLYGLGDVAVRAGDIVNIGDYIGKMLSNEKENCEERLFIKIKHGGHWDKPSQFFNR